MNNLEKAVLNWVNSLSDSEREQILFQDMLEYLEQADDSEREEMLYQYGGSE
jgi:hypothetical protein